MNLADFNIAINQMDPLVFCRNHLFDNNLWIYSKDSGIPISGSYQELRIQIANAIDINPNSIAIVGSAKYGFSMNPQKKYRPFDLAHSDIDIVIIAEDLFMNTWFQIRDAIHNGYTHLIEQHANNIIMRYITLKSAHNYAGSNYLRMVALTVEKMSKILNQSTQLDVKFKYRIYASWKDAELYHIAGINRLKGTSNAAQ